MKKTIFLPLLLICISPLCFVEKTAFAAEPIPEPYVVLKIDNKKYESGQSIHVRPGERVTIEATIMGGRRAWCLYPERYANMGSKTQILSNNENGLVFTTGPGFRGEWKLVKERADFTSGEAVSIQPVSGMDTSAIVEVPESGYSKIYLKVKSRADWHYHRVAPGGQSDKDEVNEAEGVFYLVIESEEGIWFSSNNVIAEGKENFTIRNDLGRVQEFYDLIEQKLMDRDFNGARMHINNLKTVIGTLEEDLKQAKVEDPNYRCKITFVGLPTNKTMEHIGKLKELDDKWYEMYSICQGNAAKINEILVNTQMLMSANTVKSVFKNYIIWGAGIPSFADFLKIYDPTGIIAAVALPEVLMGFYTTAESDASILENQANTIRVLSELREYYLDRMEDSVEERGKFHNLLTELEPAKELDRDLAGYFSNITWASWRKK